jgi:Phage integrase, N-terminal SAM-like domain
MATISPLRQRMIEDMAIRNLSPATRQSYIYAVARFSRHFNSSPDKLGMEQVRAYQLHLVEEKHSWSHINQVACALRFFYGVTLRHEGGLRADRFRQGAREAAACSQCRRDRLLPRSGHRIAQPGRVDDRLRGGLARWGGRASEGRLDRQRADADPH